MSSTDSAIFNRLRKNRDRLRPWAERHEIEAYRLYDRDLPDYPFLADRYGPFVVLHDRRGDIDFEAGKLKHFEEIQAALTELERPEELILKRRERQRVDGRRDLQYTRLNETGKRIVVRESQARFWVNLHDYIDTGLFLDHRRIRQIVHKTVRPGQSFLNVFSYTGAVSVFAALGGARTVNVDLSNTYTEWARDNFSLNKLPLLDQEFIAADALDYLKTDRRRFDFIYLDPPTFSNSKKMTGTFEVERDHADLIRQAVTRLNPGGTLLFSTNKRTFRLAPELSAELAVKDISRDSLPFDFRDPKIRQAYLIRAR